MASSGLKTCLNQFLPGLCPGPHSAPQTIQLVGERARCSSQERHSRLSPSNLHSETPP